MDVTLTILREVRKIVNVNDEKVSEGWYGGKAEWRIKEDAFGCILLFD